MHACICACTITCVPPGIWYLLSIVPSGGVSFGNKLENGAYNLSVSFSTCSVYSSFSKSSSLTQVLSPSISSTSCWTLNLNVTVLQPLASSLVADHREHAHKVIKIISYRSIYSHVLWIMSLGVSSPCTFNRRFSLRCTFCQCSYISDFFLVLGCFKWIQILFSKYYFSDMVIMWLAMYHLLAPGTN